MKDDRNYNVTNRIAEILNAHKGFITAVGSPRNGAIIVRYFDKQLSKTIDFTLELSPIYENDDINKDFNDVVNENKHLWD